MVNEGGTLSLPKSGFKSRSEESLWQLFIIRQLYLSTEMC